MRERSGHPMEIFLLESSAGSLASLRPCAPINALPDESGDLACLFASCATRFAAQPGLSTATGTSTYAELLHAATAVRDRLTQAPAFQPGSRVVLLLQNSLEYIAGFYGTLMAGGVVVPVAPKIERSQLQSILQSTAATHVLSQSRILRTRPHEFGEAQTAVLSLGDSESTTSTQPARSPDTVAAILFTGGSSGTPRGVMLSHRNLISNARSIQQYLRIRSSDRPLCVLPFFHAFGNSVLQSHILAGSHLILDGNTSFPETLVDAIQKHRVTSLSGVPDLFRLLLERTSLGMSPRDSLRYMAVAGGALPHDLAKLVADRIHPAEFFVMYGQTEATARLAYIPPDRLHTLESGCIGLPVPDVELQVVNETGLPVGPNTVGEIRARGPNIMLGYWGDSRSTHETIRDGWLYTGDLGSINSEGWLFHHGRRNALIKIAGYRIHPSDLEDFVTRELPIQQAIVVPFEQPGLGTRLALYVRCASESCSMSAAQVIACCREHLPRHMVPDVVEFVDAFPLNDAMKIDRPRLIALATECARTRRKAC